MESLSAQGKTLPQIKVNATVVFSILNAFSRRTAREHRLIGTLLGEVRDGVVTVSECFAVPFNERVDEHTVVINDNYHKSMYAFHRRNNKREVIVGWFATTTALGEYINDNSSLINDFYAGECASPIHLVVDTTLMGDKVNVKGFVNHKNLIGDAFHELKVDVDMTDAEATLIYHMINGQSESFKESNVKAALPSAAKRVELSTDRLLNAIDSLQQYVDDVVENKAPANREVGIAISDALSACNSSQLANAQGPSINARYQDLIMVSYLSTLAQSQALVAEKLNQII